VPDWSTAHTSYEGSISGRKLSAKLHATVVTKTSSSTDTDNNLKFIFPLLGKLWFLRAKKKTSYMEVSLERLGCI
jgi:hypothetical protein